MTVTAAATAEVSCESRHVVTIQGSESLIFPPTVVKWHPDHLAQDT